MSVKTKRIILAVTLLLALVIGILVVYNHNKPQASEGDKTIMVTVVHGDGTEKELRVGTDAETLRDALEPEGIIVGADSEYGLYILTVDGETADESLQQWWCITQDGEMLMTGADSTMIADGDHYEFTLTTGW